MSAPKVRARVASPDDRHPGPFVFALNLAIDALMWFRVRLRVRVNRPPQGDPGQP